MFYYYDRENSLPEAVCYDWNTANSKIDFKELIIKEVDDTFNLFFVAEYFSDIKNTKAQDGWNFPKDSKILVKIHKKSYERTNYKTKQKETIELTPCETYYSSLFELSPKFWLNNPLHGKIALTNNQLMENLHDLGIEPNKKEMIREMLINVQQYGDDYTSILKESDFNLPTYGKYNGKKSYSEKDKLESRWEWIADQIKLATGDYCPESIFEVSQPYLEKKFRDDEDKIVAILVTFQNCLNLIHGN